MDPLYLQLNLQFFADEEKTEEATPKKREDSRKKGQVPKSSDVNTAIGLFGMFLLFLIAIPFAGRGISQLMTDTFSSTMRMPELDEGTLEVIMRHYFIETAKILAPFFILGVVCSLVSNLVQFGFLFSTESMSFKWERINPLKGIKRIYSVRAIVEMLKALLKIVAIGLTAFIVIWINKAELFMLPKESIRAGVQLIGDITIQLGLAASILLLFLSILDYVYQKYDHEKNIKMSKKDVKDEHKKMEGDPQIKSKIKEKQQQMSSQRMMQEIPDADVVITNPTHYAVALKYQEDSMDAPIIVAKGADYLALKIKDTARRHQVATVEKRTLARGLYHQLEMGDAVPEDFFKAVAEVLAYVYKMQGKI
ncbi:flagellar biosynthesis protein FlhB [Tuberibacillus sp. Marseille-P3662]|uniref:flagellar biosynthesis protein FlhB n=1 Tax=Tuberibacillus sp. Marseille-P3662 TaxID=1965358 RepID=UPI000A1CD4BD|nr:flagellar biosynthesis protein FlhB [Tuberibacillus sp. Marseille-P3662]